MCVNSASTTPKSGSAANQLSKDLAVGDRTHSSLVRPAENKHEMQSEQAAKIRSCASAVHLHRFRSAFASRILNAGYNHDNIRNVIRSCDDLMRQELSHLQTAPV